MIFLYVPRVKFTSRACEVSGNIESSVFGAGKYSTPEARPYHRGWTTFPCALWDASSYNFLNALSTCRVLAGYAPMFGVAEVFRICNEQSKHAFRPNSVDKLPLRTPHTSRNVTIAHWQVVEARPNFINEDVYAVKPKWGILSPFESHEHHGPSRR